MIAESLSVVTCVGGPYRQLNLVSACTIDSVSLFSITSRCVILVNRQPKTHMCTFVLLLLLRVSFPFLHLRTIHGPERSKQHTLNGLLGMIALVLRLPNLCVTLLLLCFLQGMQDRLIRLKICSEFGVTVYLMHISRSRFAPLCFSIAGRFIICFPATVQCICIASAMKRQDVCRTTGTCSLSPTDVNGSTPSKSRRSHHLFLENSTPSFQMPCLSCFACGHCAFSSFPAHWTKYKQA